MICCVTQQTMSAASYSRHRLRYHTAVYVESVAWQTMSAVAHGRHCPTVCHSRRWLSCHVADNVCCGSQQPSLLCVKPDDVCCGTQKAMTAVKTTRRCLLCQATDAADCVCVTAGVVGRVTQQTLSAVRHSRHCRHCVTQQSHSRHDLLRHATDDVCCVAQQISCAVLRSEL